MKVTTKEKAVRSKDKEDNYSSKALKEATSFYMNMKRPTEKPKKKKRKKKR